MLQLCLSIDVVTLSWSHECCNSELLSPLYQIFMLWISTYHYYNSTCYDLTTPCYQYHLNTIVAIVTTIIAATLAKAHCYNSGERMLHLCDNCASASINHKIITFGLARHLKTIFSHGKKVMKENSHSEKYDNSITTCHTTDWASLFLIFAIFCKIGVTRWNNLILMVFHKIHWLI